MLSAITSITELPAGNLVNDELCIILDILFLYNPRISEVLSLDKAHCSNKLFITLKGKKRSADIIIRDRELVSAIHELAKKRKNKIFIYTSYLHVYRFIKAHLPQYIQAATGKKNKKVTHAFRYINAGSSFDDKEVKSILHHNSASSGTYYNKNIRRSPNGRDS